MKAYVLIRNIDLGYHIQKISLNKEKIENECKALNSAEFMQKVEWYLCSHPGMTQEEATSHVLRNIGGEEPYEIEVHEITD